MIWLKPLRCANMRILLWIAERLNSAVKSNAFSCLKIASDNDGKVRTYSVFSDGVRLVGVTVENSGEKASFGFEKSDITSISLGSDDTVRRNNVRVIFPKGSEIWINGFRAARGCLFFGYCISACFRI